ncbi:MAG: ABC transporter ATP-binding protein [Clostridium sp.]|jgi:ABC-2 type transport system ATP-binding protein|nr:ABC transporter ATP-binding protein [Clostridium sp.]
MQHSLSAESISKKVGNQTLLHHISLELKGGNIYGFVGQNGSGKTMLFRTLSGLIRPTQGTVLLDGENIHKRHGSLRIGMIIENCAMWPDLTGMDNLLCLGSLNHLISPREMAEAMRRVGLAPDNRLPIKKYSLGMKQRLIIAQAVMEHPAFLFLDEPTNAIDQEGSIVIRRIISEEAERGAVILLASHISQDISALCTEVYGMEDGHCFQVERGFPPS